MLSVLIFLPLAGGVLAALLPAGRGGAAPGSCRCCSRSRRSGSRSGCCADFEIRQAGLQHVTDVNWIPELGIHYKLGLDGLNLFLIR